MDTETGEMIVKRVSVPIGLEELMEGLVKEVLLKKPDDIYLFAARYFAQLLTIRDKSQTPHCKAKTLRSGQTLKEKPDKLTSFRTSKLSKQLSIREEPLDSPIVSQKPKMYHRNELKYKRRHTGPPMSLENNQKVDIRRKYARSVSTEKHKPLVESNNTKNRIQNETKKEKREDASKQSSNKDYKLTSVARNPTISSANKDNKSIDNEDNKSRITTDKIQNNDKNTTVAVNDTIIEEKLVGNKEHQVAAEIFKSTKKLEKDDSRQSSATSEIQQTSTITLNDEVLTESKTKELNKGKKLGTEKLEEQIILPSRRSTASSVINLNSSIPTSKTKSKNNTQDELSQQSDTAVQEKETETSRKSSASSVNDRTKLDTDNRVELTNQKDSEGTDEKERPSSEGSKTNPQRKLNSIRTLNDDEISKIMISSISYDTSYSTVDLTEGKADKTKSSNREIVNKGSDKAENHRHIDTRPPSRGELKSNLSDSDLKKDTLDAISDDSLEFNEEDDDVFIKEELSTVKVSVNTPSTDNLKIDIKVDEIDKKEIKGSSVDEKIETQNSEQDVKNATENGSENYKNGKKHNLVLEENNTYEKSKNIIKKEEGKSKLAETNSQEPQTVKDDKSYDKDILIEEVTELIEVPSKTEAHLVLTTTGNNREIKLNEVKNKTANEINKNGVKSATKNDTLDSKELFISQKLTGGNTVCEENIKNIPVKEYLTSTEIMESPINHKLKINIINDSFNDSTAEKISSSELRTDMYITSIETDCIGDKDKEHLDITKESSCDSIKAKINPDHKLIATAQASSTSDSINSLDEKLNIAGGDIKVIEKIKITENVKNNNEDSREKNNLHNKKDILPVNLNSEEILKIDALEKNTIMSINKNTSLEVSQNGNINNEKLLKKSSKIDDKKNALKLHSNDDSTNTLSEDSNLFSEEHIASETNSIQEDLNAVQVGGNRLIKAKEIVVVSEKQDTSDKNKNKANKETETILNNDTATSVAQDLSFTNPNITEKSIKQELISQQKNYEDNLINKNYQKEILDNVEKEILVTEELLNTKDIEHEITTKITDKEKIDNQRSVKSIERSIKNEDAEIKGEKAKEIITSKQGESTDNEYSSETINIEENVNVVKEGTSLNIHMEKLNLPIEVKVADETTNAGLISTSVAESLKINKKNEREIRKDDKFKADGNVKEIFRDSNLEKNNLLTQVKITDTINRNSNSKTAVESTKESTRNKDHQNIIEVKEDDTNNLKDNCETANKTEVVNHGKAETSANGNLEKNYLLSEDKMTEIRKANSNKDNFLDNTQNNIIPKKSEDVVTKSKTEIKKHEKLDQEILPTKDATDETGSSEDSTRKKRDISNDRETNNEISLETNSVDKVEEGLQNEVNETNFNIELNQTKEKAPDNLKNDDIEDVTSEKNLVDRVAKNYVNYIIDNDRFIDSNNPVINEEETEGTEKLTINSDVANSILKSRITDKKKSINGDNNINSDELNSQKSIIQDSRNENIETKGINSDLSDRKVEVQKNTIKINSENLKMSTTINITDDENTNSTTEDGNKKLEIDRSVNLPVKKINEPEPTDMTNNGDSISSKKIESGRYNSTTQKPPHEKKQGIKETPENLEITKQLPNGIKQTTTFDSKKLRKELNKIEEESTRSTTESRHVESKAKNNEINNNKIEVHENITKTLVQPLGASSTTKLIKDEEISQNRIENQEHFKQITQKTETSRLSDENKTEVHEIYNSADNVNESEKNDETKSEAARIQEADEKDLINSTLSFSESGLIEHKVKNFLNDFISREQKNIIEKHITEDRADREYLQNKYFTRSTSDDTFSSQPTNGFERTGSFDSLKLREELKKVEEESKFTSFKNSYNPLLLRKEIAEAGEHKKIDNSTTGGDTAILKMFNHSSSDSVKLKEAAQAVLKLQALWRGFKLRKNIKTAINDKEAKLVASSQSKSENLTETTAKNSDCSNLTQTNDENVINVAKAENVSGKIHPAFENLHILTTAQAALIIQRMWRRFKVRKILSVRNDGKLNKETKEMANGQKELIVNIPLENKTNHKKIIIEDRLYPQPSSKSHEDAREMTKAGKETTLTDLNKKEFRTFLSNDSTDSVKTVINNDIPNVTKTSSPHVLSGDVDHLLDEILDYPIMKEEDLLDSYQSRLLDKISGKQNEQYDDLKTLDNIISPRRIEDINFEELKNNHLIQISVSPKPERTDPRDRKLSKPTGLKLEILEEEPSYGEEEDEQATINTDRDIATENQKNNTIQSKTDAYIDCYETIKTNDLNLDLEQSTENSEIVKETESQIKSNIESQIHIQKHIHEIEGNRTTSESASGLKSNFDKISQVEDKTEANSDAASVTSTTTNKLNLVFKNDIKEINDKNDLPSISETKSEISQSSEHGNKSNCTTDLKVNFQISPQTTNELKLDVKSNVEGIRNVQPINNTTSEVERIKSEEKSFIPNINEADISKTKADAAQHETTGVNLANEAGISETKVGQSKRETNLATEIKSENTNDEKLYTFCSVPTPISFEAKLDEKSLPVDVEMISAPNNKTFAKLTDAKLTSGKEEVNFAALNTVIKTGIGVNETLVIPLPIEVQNTLKGQEQEGKNTIAEELRKSTSLENVSSILSNAGMNSGDLHETVVLPVNHHQSIDIGRSQPVAVQLCQTSGQVFLIIPNSIISEKCQAEVFNVIHLASCFNNVAPARDHFTWEGSFLPTLPY